MDLKLKINDRRRGQTFITNYQLLGTLDNTRFEGYRIEDLIEPLETQIYGMLCAVLASEKAKLSNITFTTIHYTLLNIFEKSEDEKTALVNASKYVTNFPKFQNQSINIKEVKKFTKKASIEIKKLLTASIRYKEIYNGELNRQSKELNNLIDELFSGKDTLTVDTKLLQTLVRSSFYNILERKSVSLTPEDWGQLKDKYKHVESKQFDKELDVSMKP